MTQPLSKKLSRSFLASEAERLVSAYAPVDEGGFAPVVFKAVRVDMLVGLGEGLSALRLDDGVAIPVALPLEDLKKRIYGGDFKDGSDIDLMAFTGEVTAEARRVILSRSFNPAAEMPKEETAERGMEITVFVHKEATDRKFQLARFNTADMAYFEPHRDRPEKETFISLKDGCKAGGFEHFYIAMPMTSFMWTIENAKKQMRPAIDLMEATRPRDAKAFEL